MATMAPPARRCLTTCLVMLGLVRVAAAEIVLPGDEIILHPTAPVPAGDAGRFGDTVALDRDLLVVGAPSDDVVPAGSNRGAVYVFERIAGSWTPLQKLVAPDGADQDGFGWDVDVAQGIGGLDDYIIVGVPEATRIGAGPDGKVYLFRRTGGGAWTFETQLVPDSEEPSSEFGFAVAVDVSVPVNSQTGDPLFTAVATAPKNDDPNTIGLADNGSVSIYQLVGGPPTWQWTHEFYGPSYTPRQEIQLGRSVALDEGLLLVGAPFWDGAVQDCGQVRLYTQGNQLPAGDMMWSFASRLEANVQAAFEWLGESVAVSQDHGTGFVGARRHDGSAGAVYVFDVLAFGSTRTEVQLLTATDAGTFAEFGTAVDIDGPFAVVGAPRALEQATDVGALYVYEQATGQPDSWMPAGRILASDAQYSTTGYGTAAAMSELTTATGRPLYTGTLDGVAYLNELSFVIFDDGFESGDTSAWSLQQPRR